MNSYSLEPIKHDGHDLTTLRYEGSDFTQERPFKFTVVFGGYFVGHQIFLGSKPVKGIEAKLKPGLKYQITRTRDDLDGYISGPLPPLSFEKPTLAEIEYWSGTRA